MELSGKASFWTLIYDSKICALNYYTGSTHQAASYGENLN